MPNFISEGAVEQAILNGCIYNRFLAVFQLWVKGERGYRRPDILLYVNHPYISSANQSGKQGTLPHFSHV